MTDLRTVSLRAATEDDERVLRELSELDSARSITRPAVLAVVDDEPVAAISLDDGRVVADPFEPTAKVVDLLRRSTSRPRRPDNSGRCPSACVVAAGYFRRDDARDEQPTGRPRSRSSRSSRPRSRDGAAGQAVARVRRR